MTRDEFMDVVHSELHSDGNNNRANRIIDAADEFEEESILSTINCVLEIVDEYEDLIIKAKASALSERTETLRAIRHAVNALSEDKTE